MRQLRITGLCLLAAFALGAVASATASAELPELRECAKVKVKGTGIWNKGCKVEGKHNRELKENEYEIQPWNLEAKKFKAKVFKGKGKGSNLDVVALGEITCTSSTDEGKFTSPKTAGGIKVTFKGCEVDHEKCSNVIREGKEVPGEIKTNTLDGEVGYINKANKEVGADLKAEAPGGYEAEFHCGTNPPLNVVVKGSVIGFVTPINTFTKKATFTFERLGTTQRPEKLEGGLPDTLVVQTCSGCNPVGAGEDASGMQNKVENTGEELELVG